LILTKIIKIVATRCQILRPKCIKFDIGSEGAYSAPPDPLAGAWGKGLAAPFLRTPLFALDFSGLNPAVLTHFSFPT